MTWITKVEQHFTQRALMSAVLLAVVQFYPALFCTHPFAHPLVSLIGLSSFPSLHPLLLQTFASFTPKSNGLFFWNFSGWFYFLSLFLLPQTGCSSPRPLLNKVPLAFYFCFSYGIYHTICYVFVNWCPFHIYEYTYTCVHAYKEFRACSIHLCSKCSKLTHSMYSSLFPPNEFINRRECNPRRLLTRKDFKMIGKNGQRLSGMLEIAPDLGWTSVTICTGPHLFLCEIRNQTIPVVQILSSTGGSKECLQGLSQPPLPKQLSL